MVNCCVISSTLLCGKTAIVFFIYAGCSTGIIPNTVTYEHQVTIYSDDILPNQIKVALSTANIMINKNLESVHAKLYQCSICYSEIISPLLDDDNV